jgi:hypothetical protein
MWRTEKVMVEWEVSMIHVIAHVLLSDYRYTSRDRAYLPTVDKSVSRSVSRMPELFKAQHREKSE